MNKQFFQSAAILALLLQPLHADGDFRRATITGGGGGNGWCTVEVNVDGTAEVEVSGDSGVLRTLSGQQAFWRRFQCNRPLPPNPSDFRFNRIAGRGAVWGSSEVCLARSARPRPKRSRQTRALLGEVTTVACSRAWSEWPCET